MISKIKDIIQTSELRKNLSQYLTLSASEPVAVSGGHSDGTRVLLDADLYNKLVEVYEDYQDSKLLTELEAEKDDRVSWSDVKQDACV
ncbi:MAG: hypothetical protein ACI9VM_000856 [Candidatus Azotimanducaceae bacterium]|jgi:hypothetical protein